MLIYLIYIYINIPIYTWCIKKLGMYPPMSRKPKVPP